MENKSVEFDKVNKNTKNQFQKSAKINYIRAIASAKYLNQRKNNRISCRDNNNNYCCRVLCSNKNRRIIVKKTLFQGQHLRIQIFQNVASQLVNFDSMEK